MDRIDLTKLSTAELEAIGNQVLRQLAKRLRSEADRDSPTPIGPHDKHGSVHARNTIVEEEVLAEGFE